MARPLPIVEKKVSWFFFERNKNQSYEYEIATEHSVRKKRRSSGQNRQISKCRPNFFSLPDNMTPPKKYPENREFFGQPDK